MCKKQTATSHSSTESEIIPLDAGLWIAGLPASDPWDIVVSRSPQINKKPSIIASLERNLYGDLLPGLLWERQFEEVLFELGREKCRTGTVFMFTEEEFFLSVYVDAIKMAGQKQKFCTHVEILMKDVDLEEPTSFFDHIHLGCTQRVCKPNETIIEEYTNMFLKNYQGGKNLTQKQLRGPLTWKVMLKSALSELANKKVEQLHKVSGPCLVINSIRKNLNQLENILSVLTKCFQNVCTWHELVDLTSYGQLTNWLVQSQNGLKHVNDV